MLQQKTWKKNLSKNKQNPKKWLEKTNREFKTKNKDRYHETGIKVH